MVSIFDSQLLSKRDLELMKEIQSAYDKTDDKQLKSQLHGRAETIRHGYGYSGGDDGSRYIPYDDTVAAASGATSGYLSALQNAEEIKQRGFEQQTAEAERDGSDRLREAYIKNMQSKLGIGQALKANGVSGGVSETTVAGIDNTYNVIRDGIKKDTDDAKREIEASALASKAESDKSIAKAEYDAALDRADRLTAAEQKKYDRTQDALEWDYRLEKDKYEREQDEYQKKWDEDERAYQRQQDAIDLQMRKDQYELDKKKAAQSAANASSSSYQKQVSNILTLMKNGYYSDEFKDILGLEDLTYTGDGNEDAADVAWKLLNKGVYVDTFPELLGYSEDVLRQYADNVLSGF